MAKTRVLGYNIVFLIEQEGGTTKVFGGTTDNTFNMNALTKESITKEDEGVKKTVITGYEYDFGANGLVEINDDGETTSIDRNDFINLIKNKTEIPFIYGNNSPGNKVQKGKCICTNYSENTGSEDIGTWSASYKGNTALTEHTVPQD